MSNTPQATTTPGVGVPIDIVRVDEPWAVAYLPDGTKIRVKLVFEYVEIVLGPDGKPMSNPDGSPSYNVKFNWVVSTRPARVKK